MSKVHITLVGGQPMPVYLGITYCKPDKVIFIYSKDSEKQKQIIKNEIKDFCEVLKSEPLNPVDMEAIESAAQKYKEKFSNDEISLNISSGTKAWSYFFAKEFENMPNAKVFYIDQNNEVYDLKSKTHEKTQSDMMIQFKLNKNPLRVFTDFKEYTEEDFAAIEKIENIRKCNIGAFTELTNLDTNKSNRIKNNQKGIFSIKKNDATATVEWDKGGFCKISITSGEKHKDAKINSPHIVDILFNAAWFELKVAKILSAWAKAKNIYMNCKFIVNTAENIKMAENTPKNEVDIIIDAGGKALFVECKTSIAHSTDIDKFNTVVKNTGGSGSKALFVCLNRIGEKESEKLRDCGMLSYSFSASNDINDLYEMLDRRMQNINK